MTPSERARSLILPATAPSTELPREPRPDSEGEADESGETGTIPSTIACPENPDLFVLPDDELWPFLDETCKLASNTASFFHLWSTWTGLLRSKKSTLCSAPGHLLLEDADEPPSLVPDAKEDEVILAAIARTVKQRWKDTGESKCRVSGVQDQKSGGEIRKGTSRPKTYNRARKEVAYMELRQYRLQVQEGKQHEHKSWVDNDVYDLANMRKHPDRNFVKGRWSLP